MAVIVSHCLMFCLFCSKKSLQTIHSLQRLAEIIEMGTGPEPISKTLHLLTTIVSVIHFWFHLPCSTSSITFAMLSTLIEIVCFFKSRLSHFQRIS
jgi:hypothetical protein